MDEDSSTPGSGDGVDETTQELVAVEIVDAQSRLDRYRNIDRSGHRGYASCDLQRFGHERGAETPRLDPVARTPHVQVYLIVTRLGTQAGCLGELIRVATSELQRHGMFVRVKRKKMQPPSIHERRRRYHLRVQPTVGRE